MHEHPLVTFPVYGLDDAWQGPRWLAFLQGQPGRPVRTVELGHGWSRSLDPDRPWVSVETLHPAADPRWVAFAAVLSLVERTAPALDETRRRRLAARTAALVQQRADGWADWPSVTWWVDGRPVPARLTGWAGAWAAVVTDLGGVDVLAVGSGCAPDGLALVRLRDGSAYHVDLALPSAYPDVLVTSAEAALGAAPEPPWRDWPLHDDHLALLG